MKTFKNCIVCIVTDLLLLPPAISQAAESPVLAELDAAREWFAQHPPNGTNAVDRSQRMAVIQKACDQVPGEEYRAYSRSWTTNAIQADHMEAATPALHYLRAATTNAMADIRRTQVSRGVAVWFLYNMPGESSII